jgi:hypothetical protein
MNYKQLPNKTRHSKAIILSILFSFLLCSGFAQAIPTESLYRGQTPPDLNPKIFELQTTSGLRNVERLTISTDSKEIYYCELNTYPPTVLRIKCYKYTDGKWQGPTVVFEGYNSPCLSVNDSIMYMQKNLKSNTTPCTYYSVRNESGWTTPVRMLSADFQTHYFQQTNLKNYYVSSKLPEAPSNSEICKVVIKNSDTTIVNLGMPICTSGVENDFYIARDESYLIVCRTPGGSASDLFISYKKEDGTWTNPKTLGNKINTPNPNWEYGPFVTPDNKYLFFTRGGNDMASYYTYWVRFDGLLDSLKHTNFVPWINKAITDTSASVGKTFTYTLPDSVFNDDDGNNTLTISATLGNGTSLPSWLLFNSQTGTFSGKPEKAETLSIKVTATDLAQATVSDVFKIIVETSNGIENPEYRSDFSVFPNPTTGKFEITFGSSPLHQASVEIFNLQGNRVFSKTFQNATFETIDLTGQPKGIYLMKSCTGGVSHNQKVCIE